MQTENIALIELGGSHDECLYSQVLFLKKNKCRVHILLFEEHLARIEAWPQVDCWQTWPAPSGFTGEWKLVFRVLQYLRRNNIRQAVINTAEGNIIRKLSMAAGRKVEFVGLIHLARKLWTSRSQRIISRKIKKYLVLAEFIRENLEKADPSLALGHFYPVYFPETTEFKEAGKQDLREVNEAGVPELNGSDFLVCIPGAVDYSRRDYISLLDEMRSNKVPAGMRFILLGRTTGPDGKALLSRIGLEGFEKHFITFEGFLEHRLFYRYLSRSDLVLPLITPGSLDYDDYLKYKITGAYNLAWGFKIPMLLHSSFKDHSLFGETSFFYRSGNMLRSLEALAGRKAELEKMRKNISGLEDFNFDIQAERYAGFLRR